MLQRTSKAGYGSESCGCEKKSCMIGWSNKLKHVYTPHSSDNFSFLYCIAAYFTKDFTHSPIPKSFDIYIGNNLIFSKFKFPFKIRDVVRFEQKNPSIRINILSTSDQFQTVCPAYMGTQKSIINFDTITLVYSISEKIRYYHLVLNLKAFFLTGGFLRGKFPNAIDWHYYFICPNCFHRCWGRDSFDNHLQQCQLNNPHELILSANKIEFMAIGKTTKTRVIGIYDFETCNAPYFCKICESYKCCCELSTKRLNIHTPLCYTLIFIDTIDKKIIFKRTKSGPNCDVDFIETIDNIFQPLSNYIAHYEPLHMTNQNVLDFDNTKVCIACQKPFLPGQITTRDHCHFTGLYRDKLHQSCNLLRRKDSRIILYAHNFVGYDSNIIIKQIYKINKPISILSHNSQKIRQITLDNFFIFRDTLEFLGTSLDSLVKLTRESGLNFHFIKQHKKYLNAAPDNKSTILDLMCSKGVLPYSWISNINILKQSTNLPEKKYFFNEIDDTNISAQNYAFAQNFFKYFECKNMLEYTKLYCEMDVFLLADVFIQFRDLLFDQFGLDPCKYISLPSFAYDSMLRLTKVSIEPVIDTDIYNFIKQSIRGGLSYISHRYHNIFDQSLDDESIPTDLSDASSSLLYIDINSLYGTAMCENMPIGSYEWIPTKDIENFDLNDMDNTEIGYILECDLSYPPELHDKHMSFPMAPECREITQNMLSPYSKRCLKEIYGKSKQKSSKLIVSFLDKKNYVVSGRNLKFYLDNGLKLEKIHRILKFKLSNFLKK